MNEPIVRSGAGRLILVLACLTGSLCLAANVESPVASPEMQEINRFFTDLERRCDAVREALEAGERPGLAAARHDMRQVLLTLDFLEREGAAILRVWPAGRQRLAALRERAKDLERRLGALLDRDRDGMAVYDEVAAPTRAAPVGRGGRSATRFALAPAAGVAVAEAVVPPGMPPPGLPEDWNREAYQHLDENPFIAVKDDPLSTFSIDVDTASYSNLRRMIEREGRTSVPKGAIRIEELVNYFPYTYRQPGEDHPLAVDVEVTGCPWTPAHRLARVALQARTLDLAERKPSNLVFLIDSSGSMRSEDKIGLLKQAYAVLVDQLEEQDRVAIVTYAGSAGLVLPSTTANNRLTLKFAVEQLSAGGTTAGGAGIKLAYQTARENYIKDGNNRVILATDGDFNVGVSSQSELVDLIKEEAKSGVFLTVLGLGTGNYQDARMEALSNHGNGNYAYIDSLSEARKVFLHDLMSTLYTVCKDVKFQIEFNPAFVEAYRLIGYENRQLADRDFTDDRKDAGEVGSGHQVTALYELVPGGTGAEQAATGDLRYQTQREVVESRELMQIKVRYKQPEGDTSTEMVAQVPAPAAWSAGPDFATASRDTRFVAAVAAFGMILRGSEHGGAADLDWVHGTASKALGDDPGGYRGGFVSLAGKARDLGVRVESQRK